MATRRFEITCPAEDCRGGYSHEQRSLTLGERKEIESNNVDLPDGVMKCKYCQCVYQRKTCEPDKILGYFDNYILGPGWHSDG